MKFATLLAFSATAYGVAFDGPLPTPVADLVYAALTGYSPAPTNMARALPDLFRRQQKPSNDSGICGYLDGDSEFPVSCTSASSCIFSSSLSWFGCSGTSSQAIMTRCVNSESVSSCLNDASCFNDAGAMACSESSAPFCVNMFAKISDATMSHWVCGKSATSVQVKEMVPATTTGEPTPIRQGGKQTGTASAGAAMGSAAVQSQGTTKASASASAVSTGAAAMQTAGVVVGVAGGLVGAFAVFL